MNPKTVCTRLPLCASFSLRVWPPPLSTEKRQEHGETDGEENPGVTHYDLHLCPKTDSLLIFVGEGHREARWEPGILAAGTPDFSTPPLLLTAFPQVVIKQESTFSYQEGMVIAPQDQSLLHAVTYT